MPRTTTATPTDSGATEATPVNGVGRIFDPEVLPPYNDDPRVRIGCIEFSRSSVINSPCFWILIGAGLALGAYWIIDSRKR